MAIQFQLARPAILQVISSSLVKLTTFCKDMYGGRYIVAIGIGMSGFIGMFQPLFVKWGVNWFITIRFLQGLAQGLTFTSQLGSKTVIKKVVLMIFFGPKK